MTIDVIKENGRLILKLQGRLDSTTAGELEVKIGDELNDSVVSLIVDMNGVDFISSKGLRVLVSAYRKMSGHEIKLTGVNNSVMEVLKLSGLLRIFTVEEV